MKPIPFENIDIKGELAVRAGRNYARLEGKWYRPDEVFTADSHGWPADWEGRLMLALVLLAQSTHRTPAYLDEIFSEIPRHLNAKGYFGAILPPGKFDEQQLGGHSWMLRALTEYEHYRPGQGAISLLESMVRGLLLPARGWYRYYPIDPVTRFEKQDIWILSKLQTKTKHHAETSDAGCAFIMLDGVTAAYEMLRWPQLKELAYEMEERFLQMDLQALHIQTHATLSAVRGLIRLYELTGEKFHLDAAERTYCFYRENAMTEAFGNYNWFGVPRWTEPCAIIDSFMVCVNLWRYLKKSDYLNDAHFIYFNALCHGNRQNGSFGTDSCAGASEAEQPQMLYPVNFETYWCCSMRGGEGFSRAIEYNVFGRSRELWFPFYNSATLRWQEGTNNLCLEEVSEYPYKGIVRFKVLSTDESFWRLHFFIPQWAKDAHISQNGEQIETEKKNDFLEVYAALKKGDQLEMRFETTLRKEAVVRKNNLKNHYKYFYGPMLLGAPVRTSIHSLDGNRFENYAEAKYKAADQVQIPKMEEWLEKGNAVFEEQVSGIVLEPLCDVKNMTREDHMHQVLFCTDER